MTFARAAYDMSGGMQTFAAICSEVCFADKPAICWCSYCLRSICSRTQQTNFGGAAISPNRPLDRANMGGIQADLSLRLASTVELRTKLTLADTESVIPL